MAKSSTGSLFGRRVIVLLLALLTVAFALFLSPAGHVTVDESVYHLMARSFADAGSFEILNGYREFPSSELRLSAMVPVGDGLFAYYPYLHPVLAYPFYSLFGYQGLFYLNSLAFLGVVGLCFAIAQRVFRDQALSLNACLILVLATYAWQYSQAAWPHALSTLFVTGAVYVAVLALLAADRRRAVGIALAAGLVVGAGVGVRIDVLFVLPALLVPFLFAVPSRPLPAIAVIAGTVPGLAALAVANQIKFGTLSPFSYGAQAAGTGIDPMSYVPLAAMGLLLGAVAWISTRLRMRALVQAHRKALLVGAALAGVGALFVPEVWALVSRVATGAYQLVVDLRIRDLSIAEGGLSRGPGGGLIYMGALKKSLLQSCPYLVVLLLPLMALLRGGRDATVLGVLLLVPAGFIGVYAYFAWHGGLGLNLRYLLPLLPITSIFAAYVWRAVSAEGGDRRWPIRAGLFLSGAVVIGAIVVFPLHELSVAALERVLLTGPLALAAVLAVTLVAWMASRGRIRPVMANGVAVALVLAFTWSGFVAFFYDYPRAWAKRSVAVRISEEVGQLIPSGSILFVELATPVSGLYEHDDIIVAQPDRDEFQSFRALLGWHLRAGRPAYAWFRNDTWDAIREGGLLDGLTVNPVAELAGSPFAQLTRSPPRAGVTLPEAASVGR